MDSEEHHEWFFETLANPLRMNIVHALLKKPMTVSEMVATVGHEQSKVSHALHVLRMCKLVFVEVRGRQHEYRANEELLRPLFAIVEAHSCKNCTSGCAQRERKETRTSIRTARSGAKSARARSP